jgi:PD-(D/E)XK nuclease superfamily
VDKLFNPYLIEGVEHVDPHRIRSTHFCDYWGSDGSSSSTWQRLRGACLPAGNENRTKRSLDSLPPSIEFRVHYKGKELDAYYKPDFICFDEVVVELKALGRLSSIEESQVINYLKVTGLHTGLLLNFGTRSLEKKRFILG